MSLFSICQMDIIISSSKKEFISSVALVGPAYAAFVAEGLVLVYEYVPGPYYAVV
jgi:hypothetical protein